MKLSKKVVFVCIALILAMGMCFAGGGKDAAKGKVTLNILGYGDNSNSEGQVFKRICEEFEAENPDIVLQTELLYDEAYHQKVTARLAAGDYPHVAYMGADSRWGTPWQEAGQQIDNTKYIDPTLVDLNLIPKMGPNGEKYYLPLGAANFCTVVAVNTELLNKIGGKLPSTYADFVALAKVCKANGIECLSTHGADGWAWGSCVMSAIVSRTTGDANFIQKAVSGQKKFTDPGFVAALDVLAQWVKDGILNSNSVLIDAGTGLSNFANGKTLMYVSGQWDFGQQNLGELSKTVKLIPIPPVPGEKGCANSIASAWQVGYGITKAGAADAKTLDAAKKWISYFNSRVEVEQRLRDGGISAPILKDFDLPADLDPCIKEKAALSAFVPCDVIDSFLTGAPNDALNAGMQEIVSGKTTAAALAAKVEGLMNR